MSLTMNRALVILVLVGYVFCEETDPEKKPPIQDAAPPDLNSTSSVVIHNKVQNLTVDYKNNHSPSKNTSYVIKPTPSSSNTTQEKPLIISTSKEVRFIQNPSKLNDSLAVPTIKSNSTQSHPNLNTVKNNTNNHKKDPPHFLPTVQPTASPSTTTLPKLSEKSFENGNDGSKFGHIKHPGQNYAYSYFKMSKPNEVPSSIKNSTSNFKNSTPIYNKNVTSANQNNVTSKYFTKATPTFRSSVTQTNKFSVTPTYKSSVTPTYRSSVTPSFGSSVTPSYKGTTDVAVEKMAVKQVRFMEDKKKNSKFQFFMVADYDTADIIDIPQKNTKLPGKSQTIQPQKPLINKENNGHSKPYNEDFVPKKHLGHYHSTSQKSTTAHKSSTVPKSTTAVPASTIRPGRYHLNSSTTFSPLPSYKINGSSLNLVKNEPPSREGCLNCEENNKHKQHKYPVYPSKKEQSEGLQAVKLLGPDGDSILGDSKHHYTVAIPGTPHKQFNTTKPRIPKSGLNYRQHQSNLDQRERRKPFQLDNAGSYSSHVGGSVDYVHRPESGFYPETRFRTKGTKKPDMSDLYNLDELESSGSSISSSHVKYETKEIHIPYAVTVEKKVSYPIHIKVDRPVPVHIDKPYPVHVEKKVPVPVKVHVPQPYPVEKEVPYPVKIPIEVPRPVEVPKPVPYIVEKPVPVQIIKEVKFPVKVPVDVPVPYKVPIQVEKRIPYFIEKKVPFEVPVAVEKPYFVEIKKPFEVPVEKPHPVTVEKKIPVPMQVIEFVKVPIPVRVPIEGYSDYVMHRSGDSGTIVENDGNVGVVPATKLDDTNTSSGKNQTEPPKIQKRMGVIDQPGGRAAFPHNIPNMISIEFSHPDLNQDPRVTLYTDRSEQPAERN